jgi:hypothetical protein
MVLQVMTDKPIEIRRGYGIERSVEEAKVVRNSRQPTPV